MKNTLHVIGWLGVRRAYLNVSLDEAKERYRESEGFDGVFSDEAQPNDGFAVAVDTFQFDDEFGTYDVWPN